MYSTCIFCHSDLGKNESVEQFPIGRRLAFDAARGRLWVVCRKCERWNLTPIEERWEAIEECERLFSGTKRRVSTEHIGLARMRDGLELVHIGEPQRPEMAAWRYGDQFGKRRRRNAINIGGAVMIGGAVAALGPVSGVAAALAVYGVNGALFVHSARRVRRVLAQIDVPGRDEPIPVRVHSLRGVRIAPHGDRWSIEVPFEKPRSRIIQWATVLQGPGAHDIDRAIISGDAALAAASKILPMLNPSGGHPNDVKSAVELFEQRGDADALFQSVIRKRKVGFGKNGRRISVAQSIWELPQDAKLALEMATHEETERRALEGELHLLEMAWREAEEIAGIADSMLVPDETAARLASLSKPRDS